MPVTGVIRGLSTYYTHGVERLEIHVQKPDAQGLPFVENDRVPLLLIINGQQYQAGLRATADNLYVWISPDLIDVAGRDVKLAHVLGAAGFEMNQRVELVVSGNVVTVRPA
jgi:hypothetical protein